MAHRHGTRLVAPRAMVNWMVPWSVLRRSPAAESEQFMPFGGPAEANVNSSDDGQRERAATDPIIPALPDPSAGLQPDASAAHRLVRALVDSGVETFFGIPGGPVSPVFDAILGTPRRAADRVASRDFCGVRRGRLLSRIGPRAGRRRDRGARARPTSSPASSPLTSSASRCSSSVATSRGRPAVAACYRTAVPRASRSRRCSPT